MGLDGVRDVTSGRLLGLREQYLFMPPYSLDFTCGAKKPHLCVGEPADITVVPTLN
jgi:hypothetical protein